MQTRPPINLERERESERERLTGRRDEEMGGGWRERERESY